MPSPPSTKNARRNARDRRAARPPARDHQTLRHAARCKRWRRIACAITTAMRRFPTRSPPSRSRRRTSSARPCQRNTSEQRTYDVAYPTYAGPHDVRFDQTTLSLGYRDGTPTPTDASYAFGPFALPARTSGTLQRSYVQQGSLATSARGRRCLHRRHFVRGRSRTKSPRRRRRWTSASNVDQRRLAAPGTNVSAGIHLRFRNLDELYVNFGGPASPTTLNRFSIKYVLNLGGGSGGIA